MRRLSFPIVLIFPLLFQTLLAETSDFTGFWEGPHPNDPHKKFYIQVVDSSGIIGAHGFWTENRFYSSEFRVDSLTIHSDSVRFFIPQWECFFRGKKINGNRITGGFDCVGDPFDAVSLKRNNNAAQFLTLPVPDYNGSDYQYRYHKPVSESELTTGRFESSGDSLFIYSLLPRIIRGEYGRLNSFLLLKNNRLICEEYYYGYTADDLHFIESSTKSITSLLIGIAMDRGFITDLQTPIYTYFPEYIHLQEGQYKDISLEYLLTMTSGFNIQNDATFKSDNRIEYALQRDLAATPGTQFAYDGGNTEILGGIIWESTGMFADEFARQYLFESLGITSLNWEANKQDGFPCMGGSLQLRPRDMAKIGLLVQNRGKYNHKQIISEQWIQKSTSFKTTTHIMGDDYAYHWWVLTLESADSRYRTIWANGWGSQFIYIIPEINAVIVTTGYNYEHDSWGITDGIREYLHFLDGE